MTRWEAKLLWRTSDSASDGSKQPIADQGEQVVEEVVSHQGSMSMELKVDEIPSCEFKLPGAAATDDSAGGSRDFESSSIIFEITSFGESSCGLPTEGSTMLVLRPGAWDVLWRAKQDDRSRATMHPHTHAMAKLMPITSNSEAPAELRLCESRAANGRKSSAGVVTFVVKVVVVQVLPETSRLATIVATLVVEGAAASP